MSAVYDTAEAWALGHCGIASIRRHTQTGYLVARCTPDVCDYAGCKGWQWVTPWYADAFDETFDVSHLLEKDDA